MKSSIEPILIDTLEAKRKFPILNKVLTAAIHNSENHKDDESIKDKLKNIDIAHLSRLRRKDDGIDPQVKINILLDALLEIRDIEIHSKLYTFGELMSRPGVLAALVRVYPEWNPGKSFDIDEVGFRTDQD